jgi:translocation and assembly module TamA
MICARTASPHLSSIIARLDLLGRVLALISLMLAPLDAALAQSRDTDPALEDLIPDAAIDNPESWSRDTAAAGVTVPDLAGLLSPDLTKPLTQIPEIAMDWPDSAELVAVTPLTPDPDIAAAQDQVKTASAAFDAAAPDGDPAFGQIADADVVRVNRQVELAFPPALADFTERDAIAARFGGLSSLRALPGGEDNLAQLSRRGREDLARLTQIMRLYGYYDAEIAQSIVGPEGVAVRSEGLAGAGAPAPFDAKKVVVRFDVVPGPQYTLDTIALGDVDAAADGADLRAAFAVKRGDAVNSDRITLGRAELDRALGETGYAFAKVGEPALVIDHAARSGDLDVPVTTGGVYAFGAVRSLLPDYLSSRHLQRIARFDPGDPYRRTLMDDLRKAVLATGLVSSVTLQPREAAKPEAGKPGLIDLDVAMVKAPQRTIAGLIGVASGEGLRVEGSWEHRNFFPPEGLVRARTVVGTREQLLGFTIRKSNFRSRDQSLTGDLFAQTRRTDAFNSRTLSALVTLEKQTTLIFQKPWTYSFGIEVLATNERQTSSPDSARATYFIAALPLRAMYDGSDDLFDPKRGFRVSLRASPEASVQDGMRSTYVRTQLDASAYKAVSDAVVLAGRIRLGSIPGAETASIAPSRRLYSGGSASVRGYAYQAVGPRDANNAPSGGRSLTEIALEARIRTGLLGGLVSLVPFVDAGTVGPVATPTLRGVKVGVGVGVRYQTSFGPIRIDLGTPLNPSKGDSRIGVYVALGQAF